MSEKMLKLPQVIEKTTLSRSTIYSYIKDNTFPKPVKVGVRAVAWVESEILDFINQRAKMRDGAQ